MKEADRSMTRIQKIKNIALLQFVIIIYTISSVRSKEASASGGNLPRFLFFFGMEFVMLGVYALLWQQIIKRFALSVAYANRSMSVVWSMVWAVIFFHDTITMQNVAGVVLVVAGIWIINTDTEVV